MKPGLRIFYPGNKKTYDEKNGNMMKLSKTKCIEIAIEVMLRTITVESSIHENSKTQNNW
jgi:hypothetical protein